MDGSNVPMSSCGLWPSLPQSRESRSAAAAAMTESEQRVEKTDDINCFRNSIDRHADYL